METFTALKTTLTFHKLCVRSRLTIRLLAIATIVVYMSSCDSDDSEVVAEPGLLLMAEGLTSPVTLTEAPDGSGNIFIADQVGLIRILTADGELLDDPFLDIRDKIVTLNKDYDERGLLGLAFHPDYKSNGRFFVYYSAPLRPEGPGEWNHTAHLSEFKVSGDPMKADEGTEKILLRVDQPQMNHNGGTLAFGPTDRFLYISIGDGGNRDDEGVGHVSDWYDANEGGNGQDIIENLLGNILRINVDGSDPYTIPADNPYVGQEGMDEIYAYGFRNPYRFSFDMGGGNELYVGDAGQELWEEISIVEKGGNYGWNVKEGSHCFDAANPENPPADCPETDPDGDPLIDPIIEFENSKQSGGLGLVVVGGYVYRGNELPIFNARYIFGTWSSQHKVPDGKIFVAISEPEGLWDFEEINFSSTSNGNLNAYLLGFGQDAEGEVYILTTDTAGPSGDTGKIFKLVSDAK